VTAIEIRTGAPGDLTALRRLFRRSSLSVEAFREALLADPEALELSDTAVAEGRTRVAVAADGAIVGFITFLPLGGLVLELEDLFVDPDRMRQGVARQLVDHLTTAAKRDGISSIEVTANPYAVAFYRSVGFVHMRDTDTKFGPAPRMRLLLADDGAAGAIPEAGLS